jgi:cytochrome c oxidase subunit 2
VLLATGAMASQFTPWQMNVPEAISPVAERIHEFHNYLLVLITVITVFVLALMVYVCVRFKASNNPNPSKTTHNTLIEILWTAVPVIILVIVAVPSFKSLYYGDRTATPDMTIKITANQWYWNYEYPDAGIAFDSYMIPKGDIDPAKHTYLLSVDNPLVVPVGKKIQILVTSNDVMHSFFVPSAVVQIYGMIGRINETWMQIDKEGTVYGQCNQICGINHSAMPIQLLALSQEKYDAWLAEAKVKFAAGPAPVRVADGAVNE